MHTISSSGLFQFSSQENIMVIPLLKCMAVKSDNGFQWGCHGDYMLDK